VIAAGTGLSVFFVLSLAGCGGGAPKTPSKYPPQPEGCAVQIFHDTPSMPTENIGSVSAICGEDIKDEECFRTLKDETCKLGGDVVWGVAEKPSISLGKKKLSGRAAHTK